MAGDRRLVLPVAGAADLVPGGLEELDDRRRTGAPSRAEPGGSRRSSVALSAALALGLLAPGGRGARVSCRSRSGRPRRGASGARGRRAAPGRRRPRPGRAPRPARSPRRASARVPGPRGAARRGSELPAGSRAAAPRASAARPGSPGGRPAAGACPCASSTCASRSRPKAKPTPRSSRSLPRTRARPSYRPPPQTSTGPLGRRHDQLEDHLRVEPDPPAEPQVELDAVEVDAEVLERPDQVPERGDRVGGQRLDVAARGARGPRPAGRGGRPARGPAARTRSSDSSRPWPRSHLRRSRWTISWPERRPVTTGTSVRKSRSMPRSSARSTAPGISRRLGGLEPAGELFQAPLQRPDVPPLGGGLAEHLDQGRRQRRRQARALEHLEDQPDVPEPDRRPGDAGLGQGPVGQPDDLGVGQRPRVAEPLDADLLELAEPAGPGRLVAEDRPGVADPPGQSRGARPRPCRPGRSRPSARGGGRRPPAPTPTARTASPRSPRRSSARAAR